MGTWYNIIFKEEHKNTGDLAKVIDLRLSSLNQNLSTYIEQSDLNQLNRSSSDGCVEVSDDTAAVMKEALRIYNLSNGAFDPGLGPLIELWGFDKKDTHEMIPNEGSIQEMLTKLTFGKSELNEQKQCIKKGSSDLAINFSAIAKGYAVDELAEVLEKRYGIKNYLVEIGGEVKVKGNNNQGKPWRIAIEAPDPSSRTVQKIVNPGIMGVATSGDYRNYFEKDGKRYSHTINPVTGYPIDHQLASVTVIHPSAMTADALATAFMVLGDKIGYELAEKNKIAVFMIIKTADGFEEQYNQHFKPYLN
ncbi:FAD:protein FMN transferase [Pleionea sediminis]|uniref:FAD:protein FMN transferase n=1 Tax=Pleionea sediminis TaxID=2569479 RepID=UPI0013DE6BBF|nr:FAD:protein FMN transferase [Pleionea sediminis]